MEVKMAQTVSHMDSNFVHPGYSSRFPQLSVPTSPQLPQRKEQWLLSATEWESTSPKAERRAPSRNSSFRFQEMDEREKAEWVSKEKMLVYELREKLRKQGKIDEEEMGSSWVSPIWRVRCACVLMIRPSPASHAAEEEPIKQSETSEKPGGYGDFYKTIFRNKRTFTPACPRLAVSSAETSAPTFSRTELTFKAW